MDMFNLPQLGYTDYSVFGSMLAISLLIGIYSSFKGSNTSDDYLLGSRSFGWPSVSVSLLTTFISSISLLGYSGETYSNGIQLFAMLIGACPAIIWNYYTSLEVFYSLQLTSVTEYVSLRYKSESFRHFVTFLVLLKNILYLGVCLYAPTIAITSVTSLETHQCIYILGIICTIYSTIGGMRAVIWTDVFQMVIMFVGVIVVCSLAVSEVGGLGEVWSVASEGNRTHLFDIDLNIFERHTFVYVVLFGFFFWGSTFGIDQLSVQRICSLGNGEDLIKVVLLLVVGMAVTYSFIFFAGLACYAVYHGCDPTALGIITKKEEIVPYFIMHKASFIWGIPGLFIASIFSATLSSLSSSMNGIVAVIWTDVLQNRRILRNKSDFAIGMINKLLTILTGAVLIGVSLLCSYIHGVVEFCITVMGVISGPLYGMFLLGLLCPKAKVKGAFIGLISSWLLVSWIAIGSYSFRPPTKPLPYSLEACNETILLELSYNQRNVTYFPDEVDTTFRLYQISYILYPVIGSICSFLVGLIVTLITGTKGPIDTPPNLLAPFVRRRYWKRPTNLGDISNSFRVQK